MPKLLQEMKGSLQNDKCLYSEDRNMLTLHTSNNIFWASQVTLLVKNLSAKAGDIRDASSIHGLGRPLGGGHGNPLQYSCLKNPMDTGAWQATVHGVAKSWTQLSIWTHSNILQYTTRRRGHIHQCNEGSISNRLNRQATSKNTCVYIKKTMKSLVNILNVCQTLHPGAGVAFLSTWRVFIKSAMHKISKQGW